MSNVVPFPVNFATVHRALERLRNVEPSRVLLSDLHWIAEVLRGYRGSEFRLLSNELDAVVARCEAAR